MTPKKTYVGIYIVSFGLGLSTLIAFILLCVFGLMQKSGRAVDAVFTFAGGFGILALLQFVIVHAVCNFGLLARMWRAIQDGQTTMTVKRAIGFLFVPVFNLYWIFRAWGGFPAEYNRYVERYALPVPPLAEKVFVVYPVLLLLAAILCVPLLAVPFVFLVVAARASGAVNALDEAVRTRRDELAASRPPFPETIVVGDLKIKL